ncbi:unnamed protein product, partial [Dicrocoelium dendriticum]
MSNKFKNSYRTFPFVEPSHSKKNQQFDSGLVVSSTTNDGIDELSMTADMEVLATLDPPDPMSRSLFEWDSSVDADVSPTMARKRLMLARCTEVLTSLLQMTGDLADQQSNLEPNTLGTNEHSSPNNSPQTSNSCTNLPDSSSDAAELRVLTVNPQFAAGPNEHESSAEC